MALHKRSEFLSRNPRRSHYSSTSLAARSASRVFAAELTRTKNGGTMFHSSRKRPGSSTCMNRILSGLATTVASTIFTISILLTISVTASAAAGGEEGLVISVIDSALWANQLCEGGPRVCQSGRFLMVVILNMSDRTFEKATLTCSVFRKGGKDVIEKATKEISGPILPRRVNAPRQRSQRSSALMDRALADAVAFVEFSVRIPSDAGADCDVTPVGDGRVVAEPVAIELRRADLVRSAYSAEIRMEFLSRYFTVNPTLFVRVICDVFDNREQKTGSFSRDYHAYGRGRPFMLYLGQYWRPVMRIDFDERADHVSCRFANKDDPLPVVRTDDIDLTPSATHSISSRP